MPESATGTIEYRAEAPTLEEFERLYRASGWTEAYDTPLDKLATAIHHPWYSVCARIDGECVGTGLVLSDGGLHALITDVIVLPELRGRGIGTGIMRRIVERCRNAGIVSVQLFSARGKRHFYESLGFVARPDDGPGMELG